MPTARQQPTAIENLRTHLSRVRDATGLFDAMVGSTGDYFRDRADKRVTAGPLFDKRSESPGQVELWDQGVVVVFRRTMSEADTGVYVLPAEHWTRFREGMEKSYRDWLDAIETAIAATIGLRAVRFRYCPALPETWFTELLADLAELRELRHPLRYGDGSSFWKYASTRLGADVKRIEQGLRRAFLALETVEPAPLRREINLRELLRLLGREPIRLTDLPADIGPPHMRALDAKGWVVVRGWGRVDNGSTPSQPRYIDSPVGQWLSPVAAGPDAGDVSWDYWFNNIAPPWSPAAEVRLTELGLCELDACQQRTPAPSASPSPADSVSEPSPSTRSAPQAPDEPHLLEVHIAVLRRLRDRKVAQRRNELWEGLPQHGRDTIRDAVDDLHRWKFVHGPKGSPRGASLLEAGRAWLSDYENQK